MNKTEVWIRLCYLCLNDGKYRLAVCKVQTLSAVYDVCAHHKKELAGYIERGEKFEFTNFKQDDCMKVLKDG